MSVRVYLPPLWGVICFSLYELVWAVRNVLLLTISIKSSFVEFNPAICDSNLKKKKKSFKVVVYHTTAQYSSENWCSPCCSQPFHIVALTSVVQVQPKNLGCLQLCLATMCTYQKCNYAQKINSVSDFKRLLMCHIQCHSLLESLSRSVG